MKKVFFSFWYFERDVVHGGFEMEGNCLIDGKYVSERMVSVRLDKHLKLMNKVSEEYKNELMDYIKNNRLKMITGVYKPEIDIY